MIPANAPSTQPTPWQVQWREAVREPAELLAALGLERLSDRLAVGGTRQFPLRVPRHFLARMRHGDADDPLLRQVLPLDAEDQPAAGFGLDAVGDLDARAAPGLLHKYEGRALLVATGSCAIHCRYCFRRHFPYAEETAAANQWSGALDHLRRAPDIEEVLLSGGDPLSLSTAKLRQFTDALSGIGHVKRLRLHTRLPIVLPARIDAPLLDWIAGLAQQCIVVVHANHPNEIDRDVTSALTALREAGATVLNQAVLLRGVNDDVESLAGLSLALFESGTLPYYLHQLDRVAGVAHFEVDDARALQLVEALRTRLPGYLVPKLVREVAGAGSKLPL
ncbi:EF-P beta-lysylation protein EpmB [Alkalisalibacterium limincola]|uniref:L-lysine 2,3-aminomutase n=1 Tax=Alkalisalibacterium limincola TaxID=2699169 RepID=A0A5C8KV17_9GAMM|nr:EF-P beta-lysylation protein EpmB [Alkalisalibacterium limincola]TXK65824.1 EF-P beta-lysylation protein EpmB [Alkalisalibacterium limincola]